MDPFGYVMVQDFGFRDGRVGPFLTVVVAGGYRCHIDTRTFIRHAVLARTGVDEREVRSLIEFISYFDVLERPFSEDADHVHVTGSAIVVGNRGVVLHLHKRLQIWLQPGGHIEAGELAWEGALREAREETGLLVAHPVTGPELVHVDVHPGPRGHTHLDLRYLLCAPDDDPAPPPGESQDVRWFTWGAAIERADDGLVGALRSLRGRYESTE